MTDKLLAEYSKSNPNFYDGYWRSNPRRNAKCSQMLYGDSYLPFFQTDLKYGNLGEDGSILEEFANLPQAKNNIQEVSIKNIPKPVKEENLAQEAYDSYADSFGYLGDNSVKSISCDGKQAQVKFQGQETKMYDIDLLSIMKKKVLGDVKEIDEIHNARIKNTTFFGDMKLQHLGNTLKNLHYQVNPSLFNAHQRSFQRESFFQDR